MDQHTQLSGSTTRRTFLASSAAIAGAAASRAAFAQDVPAASTQTLKIGLIGCGGRGTGAAAQALAADKNVVLTAMGDAFPDRLEKSLASLKKGNPEKVKVEADHCFVGFDAYEKVIASGVDVVILTTPPGFRPIHLRAAIDAGKHVFLEKPVAVDAPGLRAVMQAAEDAKRKNLALVCGFCWRYSYPERAFFERIHAGDIGKVVAIYSTYNTGSLWSYPRKAEWSDMEYQMRNWLYYTWLSGDHIVEQAVHTIDKIGWTMQDKPPVKAWATGGRQVRTEPLFGHIFDHFAVVYEWADNTRGFLYCRQQAGCASDVSDHLMGTKGLGDINPGNSAFIRGDNPWRYEGPKNNMYQTEHDELFASIRAGKPLNDGQRMCNSTMMAILGRMAAYTGKVITWEQALNSQENLIPQKLEFGPLPTPAVALPGKTKFI